jgi:hypothetical protein
MVAKVYQNPKGGLNARGRAFFKRKEGANLKAPVKKGTNPRRVSFAARFAGMKGPMKDDKGRPTRKALALKAWGFGSVEAARNFANRNKKSKDYLIKSNHQQHTELKLDNGQLEKPNYLLRNIKLLVVDINNGIS